MHAREHAKRSPTMTRWSMLDAMDAALGSCSEAQGSRATWSSGCFAMLIHRTHPLPAYGGPRAVTGGSRGRRDVPTDPLNIGHVKSVGKGLITVARYLKP